MLGMDATVSFTAQSVTDVLLLKRDAFKSKNGEVGVYVPVALPDGSEKAEFRPVKRGLTDGLNTQIISGLNENDRVYTRLPQIEGQDGQEEPVE